MYFYHILLSNNFLLPFIQSHSFYVFLSYLIILPDHLFLTFLLFIHSLSLSIFGPTSQVYSIFRILTLSFNLFLFSFLLYSFPLFSFPLFPSSIHYSLVFILPFIPCHLLFSFLLYTFILCTILYFLITFSCVHSSLHWCL